jgi:Na+/H+ antiporter NhaA
MRNSPWAEKPARAGGSQGSPPEPPVASSSSGRTAWLSRDTPLRRFLSTETGSGAVLVGAAVAALIWANLYYGSYQRVWNTLVSIRVGQWDLSLTLRQWINSGLMAFFFLVVGLEARREFDVGEFRERPRIVLPVLAGLGGMVGAIGIYLAVNAGRSSIHGWGVSMSTDTAFALGVFALLGSRAPNRLRALILTVTVVDDIVGLVVIATVYSHHLSVAHVLVAAGAFAIAVLAAWRRVPFGLVYFGLAAISWVALAKSGVDPIIVGLGAGLIAYAAPATRSDLERATRLVRDFREQPTPGRAQVARTGLATAISPNDRLAQIYHPWTSYVIVPLFGLANAGIPIDAKFLASAYRSPVTLGIIFGYVIGKPLGVTLASAVVTKASRGRLRPPVGWAAVIGGGATAGTGFTVSLLIASVAFRGSELKEATLGILTAAVLSAVLAWLVFAAIAQLPAALRARALFGRSEVIVDLVDPVDPDRDHVRGPASAPVTLVEYGDFQCPHCREAEPTIRQLLADFSDLRYAWRHLPLNDVHPQAQLAAEASEAAGAQGAFWAMHDTLLEHQGQLAYDDLIEYARRLGLDVVRFATDLENHRWSDRVAADVEGADLSGVSGTPTFFVNGQRQPAPYDTVTLSRAVQSAHTPTAAKPAS